MKILKLDKTTNTIKIDIDAKNRFILDAFLKRFSIFCKELSEYYKINSIRVFETNKGYHIYIILDSVLTSLEASFLSLWLGSDYQRELLNYKRYLTGSDCQSVLFHSKITKSKGYEYTSKEVETINSRKIKSRMLKIKTKYCKMV